MGFRDLIRKVFSREEVIFKDSSIDKILEYYPNKVGLKCPDEKDLPPSWEYLGRTTESNRTAKYLCRNCGKRYFLADILEYNKRHIREIRREIDNLEVSDI